MPAHTSAWNNLSPVGSDLASSIDDFMRSMKVDIDERMSLAHYWGDAIAVGNNQDGTHKEITITASAANVALLKTNANQSLTGSDATPAVDLGITWNTTGAPTAIKANVTNTASDAAALLLDLQVGGTSQFKVSKAGNVTILGTSLLTGNTTIGAGSGNPKLIVNGNSSQVVEFQAASVAVARITNFSGNEYWDSDGGWNWRNLAGSSTRMSLSSAGLLTVAGNVAPANVILANNTFLYGTTTGASNLPIIGLDNSNVVQVGFTGSSTTNFRTGSTFSWNIAGTVVWNINSSGHLYPNASSTYDLGSSSNRVRTIYGVSLDVLNGGGTITGSSGSLTVPGNVITSGGITVNSEAHLITVGSNVNATAILQSGDTSGATQRGANLKLQSSTAAAYIELESGSGTLFSLWVDSAGKLRIHTVPPHLGSDTAGTVVGAQVA